MKSLMRASMFVVSALAIAVSAMWVSQARGAFGDSFGIAPVNVAGAQSAPAFPAGTLPEQSAFWAGTCDLGLAPAPPPFVPHPGAEPPPSPISAPGVGGIPHAEWEPVAADPKDPIGSPAIGKQVRVPAPSTPLHCIDWGRLAPNHQPAYPKLWRDPAEWVASWGQTGGGPPSWRLPALAQAGAHPDGSTTTWFRRDASGRVDGSVDNIYADLPAGFVGNPRAVPKCTADQFAKRPIECPPESQVGVVRLYIEAGPGSDYPASNDEILPVYNIEPRKGRVAELGIPNVTSENATTVRIVAKARTNGDFGVTGFVGQVPAALPSISTAITLWGVPWSPIHDQWRPPQGWTRSDSRTREMSPNGLPLADRVHYQPSWGPVRPFLSNPTECTGGELFTRLSTDSFRYPGSFTAEGDPALPAIIDNSLPGWKVYESPAPPVTGCEKTPFDAGIDLTPSSTVADSPSGLSVDLSIPQNDDLPFPVPGEGATQPEVDGYLSDAVDHWRSDDGISTSQLDRAVVTLPEGVSVNPSGATGLAGCSDAQMGVTNAATNPMLFNNEDPFDGEGVECPEGSKIGTVQVDTPLLDDPLTGDVVLGMPKSTDPESGQMFRLFVVARDPERGLIAKIAGTSVADNATGQLTTTFDKNPRVPFELMHLELKGGQRGLLALPQQCKTGPWSSLFTPWSAAHGAGGLPSPDAGAFVTNQRCGPAFNPALQAGMKGRQAGGSGTFTFRFSRTDGQQWFRGASAEIPPGLVASVRDVPLCSNAQANANACPLASRIGSVDASAGSGTPFVLEKKGSVFLTEGYKGAPYGLAVSVPVEAGPFRGQFALKPIVVRQALRVDPTDASVTAVSDPLPTIHHGIPLRARDITVTVDRPGFMRNPTDCSRKQIKANLTSLQGATASPAVLFQASGCANLPFKPKLAMRLTGKRQTKFGGHPGIKATLTQPAGQANIKATTVRLPKALVLDPSRVADESRLCEFEASKTANCPAGSIIGRAKAISPLLRAPLEGPVYFAKNRRINEFGRSIATFPSLVLALRGEIALNVRANSDVKPNKLVSTFPAIPDAPVSRFELSLQGGRNGILVVTKDARTERKLTICGKQIAEVDMDAHNGRQRDFDVRMKTPCKKAKAKKAVCKTKKQKRTKACKQRAKRRATKRR